MTAFGLAGRAAIVTGASSGLGRYGITGCGRHTTGAVLPVDGGHAVSPV